MCPICCCADVAKEALQRCMNVECDESRILSVEFDYCYIYSFRSNAKEVDDEKVEDNGGERNSLTEYVDL